MVSYVEIETDGWRFQPRVAAVCVWRDHVLLQQALDGEFWVLPGGRILPLELTADALARTLQWELAEEVTIERLLWVMEYVSQMAGRPLHEIGFYYAVALPRNSRLLELAHDHAGVERGRELRLRWFPIRDLPDVPLLPDFLRTAIADLPAGPQHVVRVDATVA